MAASKGPLNYTTAIPAAMGDLMARFRPCPACDSEQAGPIHRTSTRLWRERAERARRAIAVAERELAEAEGHLAAIAAASMERRGRP